MRVNNKPGYKRSEWYYSATRIEYRKDNVFSQTDNAKHDQRRKQMAPGVCEMSFKYPSSRYHLLIEMNLEN